MRSLPICENESHERQLALQAAIQSRYAWLLRWALHFTENDRDAAEDLVQETFVHLLLAWDTLRNHDDLEPLLYSYLRYTHLSQQRRAQKQALQRPSSTDFDTLATSLSKSSRLDQIEVQNDLRTVLDFLLWRRHSARFASIFLLRFFHGYFPEEIASICISKRFAVDIGLGQARRELKTHLANPHRLRVLGRDPFPEQKPNHVVLPAEEFEDDLRNRIFHSAHDACPAPEVYEFVYNSNSHPVKTAMIAHIVACEQCLDQISRRCGAPPPSGRSMDESLGRAPRGTSKRPSSFEKQRLARIFAAGEHRMREIYDHYPTELRIVLNAEVAAVRDVPPHTTRATLNVETSTIDKLEIVEILSEGGLPMLSMPLREWPPRSQSDIRHAILLSGDRTLSLVVRFTCDGALIEVAYEGPHGAEAMESPHQLTAVEEVGPFTESAGRKDAAFPEKTSLWHSFLNSMRWRIFTARLIVPATTIILAGVALFVALTVEERQRERLDVNQLLRVAVHAETALAASSKPSVIVQEIQIKTAGLTVRRNLYRDSTGKRQPKELPLDKDEQILRAKLVEAKLDWNNPLSDASFRDWHDHLYRGEDRIAKTGANLLTVSTTATEGAIAEEELTVQADSFHAVALTVRFRDGEAIEIAELHYETVPWSPQVEQWFEPLASASSISRTPAGALVPPAALPLSEEQLDVAALSTHLALQQLHADAERLEVAQTAQGVTVKGIVESDERKAEITARLRAIPHVFPAISSYRDLNASTAAQTISQISEVTVSESDTPIKSECDKRHIATDPCSELSYELLNDASALLRESKHLHELQVEFPASRRLTAVAQGLLVAIVRQRLNHIEAALDDEQHILQSLGEESSETENPPSGFPLLEDAAQNNLSISQEFLYNSNEHPRPVPVILHEFAESLHAARAAVSHEAAELQARLDAASTDTAQKP